MRTAVSSGLGRAGKAAIAAGSVALLLSIVSGLCGPVPSGPALLAGLLVGQAHADAPEIASSDGGASPSDEAAGAERVASSPLALAPHGLAIGFKLLLSLAAVVGLILLLQRAARRWGNALGTGPGADQIRIVSQRSIGPRLSLALVQVMGRNLLVGISPQGIRPVADLGVDGEEGRAPVFRPEVAPTGARPRTDGWGGLLSRFFRGKEPPRRTPSGVRGADPRFRTAPAASTTTPAAGDFEDELARRLESLRGRYPTVAEIAGQIDGVRR